LENTKSLYNTNFILLVSIITKWNLLIFQKSTGDKSAIERSSDSPNCRRPLPLELNCEIYKCLAVPIQTKFIWGLGRDIYGIFRRKLLVKVNLLLVEIEII
jgi:hypothetical protein